MLVAHTTRRGILSILLLTAISGVAHGQFGGFGIQVGGQNFQFGGGSGYRQPQRFVPQNNISIGNFQLPTESRGFVPQIATESLRQLTGGQPQFEDRRYRPDPTGRLDLGNFRFEHAAALAVAVAQGGRFEQCENPFCETPPVPCRTDVVLEYTPEQYFEQAKEAFRYRQYDYALDRIQQAQTLLPNEPDLFQFRSLILFAQGEYTASAAAAYTALSSGPGWNWDTLYGFYGNAGLYTQHLRALEAATKTNPESAEHHFLHGYHCLMLGHLASGRKKMHRVLEIQPDEPLTKALMEMLPEAN